MRKEGSVVVKKKDQSGEKKGEYSIKLSKKNRRETTIRARK